MKFSRGGTNREPLACTVHGPDSVHDPYSGESGPGRKPLFCEGAVHILDSARPNPWAASLT
jgi:hypothetical protein